MTKSFKTKELALRFIEKKNSEKKYEVVQLLKLGRKYIVWYE